VDNAADAARELTAVFTEGRWRSCPRRRGTTPAAIWSVARRRARAL